MDHILNSFRTFFEKHDKNGDLIKDWKVTTIPHTQQSDGYNCGVYCMKFLERFMSGSALTGIDTAHLDALREQFATKMMLFEDFMKDCCRKCGFSIGNDETIECSKCKRIFHFKTFCIAEDLEDADNEFFCRLCKIDFWPSNMLTPSIVDQKDHLKWTCKTEVHVKLKKQEMADDDVVVEKETSGPIRKRRQVRINQLEKEVPNKKQRLKVSFTKRRQEEIKKSKGVQVCTEIPIITKTRSLETDLKKIQDIKLQVPKGGRKLRNIKANVRDSFVYQPLKKTKNVLFMQRKRR